MLLACLLRIIKHHIDHCKAAGQRIFQPMHNHTEQMVLLLIQMEQVKVLLLHFIFGFLNALILLFYCLFLFLDLDVALRKFFLQLIHISHPVDQNLHDAPCQARVISNPVLEVFPPQAEKIALLFSGYRCRPRTIIN